MHRVVPDLILENLRASRYSGEFPAVGMFLDLSGFSTLTDVLMQHGQHGAEVLASLMHGIFDPLVESVFNYGGRIVGFAGDGIMALYPIEREARTTALRALASAYVIQRELSENPTRQTIYGKFPVSVKIGLASGSVSWGILLSEGKEYATYYCRGSAVNESADAEHHARAGDILLAPSIAKLLLDEVEGTPHLSFLRFSQFRVAIPEPAPVTLRPVDLELAKLFMPEEVIAYDIRGEFRQVVNLFIRFPDLSEQQLHDLVKKVFELHTKYGGLLSRLDFGDKGCNLLLLWGAPTAYENDIGRALNFLLDLKSQVDFPLTSGVTYYIAHAGYIGSAMCEDYTCYGWGVNLASRFMMSAPVGETWVDDRIARRIASRFETEFVGSQLFKGFATEQKVHRLRGHREILGPIYQGELVGRDDELDELVRFTEPLWQNRFAGLMLVSGDAGIGKGRLVHEFRSSKMFDEKKILWAVCQSDQILRQSFNPFRNWLYHYFGISHHQSPEDVKQAFDAKLDELVASIVEPELAREVDRTRPILGALLGLRWDDSLYEQLDAEGRYNNTFLALIALFKAESRRQPLVIFLEDYQFTDNDSRDFLPHFKRAILAAGDGYPIAVIVTTRPFGVSFADDLIDMRIQVPALSRAAIARLAETMLGGAPAPDLVTLLMYRSEGNPYFVEQFLRYLQEEDLIETSQAGWTLIRRLRSNFLPGDIRSILVARLDQLKREVKEIIQTASVLGREFEIRVLSEMLHEDDQVQANVAEAENAAIWAPLTELRYMFSHGLLRDAAYEMQMQARRAELHALALEALETLHADELQPHYAELAYHSEHAGLHSKATDFYTLAARTAAGLYQNKQGIEYYSRALALTPPHDLAAQFDLLLERVELLHRLGDRPAQLADLDLLQGLAEELGDNVRLAKMLMCRTVYCYVAGNYTDAIGHAAHAEPLSDPIAETDLVFLAQTTWVLALLRLGRLDEAFQRAESTLQRVQRAGNRREESRVLSAMGWIAQEQRDPAAAHHYHVEALQIARETKDRGLEHRALNNLAMSEGNVYGNYETAHEYYQQAYNIAHEMGDRNAEGIALANLAFNSGMQGDFDAAHRYHEQSLRVAREAGNLYHETYTLINLSAITGIQNEPLPALECARQALALAQKAGERSGEAWAQLYMGHAYLLMNEYDQAQQAYQASLEIRNALGQTALCMEPLAGMLELALRQDEPQTASSVGEKILAYLDGGGTLNGADEPLRVYHSCFLFLTKKQDPRSNWILQSAIQLLDTQVSKLKDESARRMYIENVPWRLALWTASRNDSNNSRT